VGKPNVGKSTLLNRLLKEDRAIVTPIPGTTRDTIEGELNVRGRYFKIVDTAGLRKTSDIIENMGVERSKREVERSDLVLFVIDNSFGKEDLEIYEELKGKKHVVVLNKIDLGVPPDLPWDEKEIVKLSALTGEGITDLEERLLEETEDVHEGLKGKVILTSERQLKLIDSALNYLSSALESSKSGFPNDVVAIDIWKALSKLDEITGRNYKEDLIDTIFSSFCVGK
jgi:tRNA modification GTPase